MVAHEKYAFMRKWPIFFGPTSRGPYHANFKTKCSFVNSYRAARWRVSKSFSSSTTASDNRADFSSSSP
jgi:hypothetical protein